MSHRTACTVGLITVGILAGVLPIRAELVGYWPFNASAGDTVADAAENGHDGALLGPNRVSAKIGNGLEFRGAAVVEIANSPKLNFNEDQSMTIAVGAL